MQLLQFPAGAGWLVLSGGHEAGSEIRAHAIERAGKEGPTAYISFADDGGDALLDDMEDLGASTGYMVDVRRESVAALRQQLQQAGVIVIQPGASAEDLYTILLDGVADILLAAYQTGTLILLEETASSIFGRWYIDDQGQIADGLNWLQNMFIVPGITSAKESESLQNMLVVQPETIAVSIGVGSALVLGATNQVETWGKQQVTISLGSGYHS